MGPRESTPGAYCMWAEYLRVNPHSRSSSRRSRCTRPSGPGPPGPPRGEALGPALALALPPPLTATSCQPISKGCARTMASMSSRRALCSAGCAAASHQDENKHRKKRRCHGCSAHPIPPQHHPVPPTADHQNKYHATSRSRMDQVERTESERAHNISMISRSTEETPPPFNFLASSHSPHFEGRSSHCHARGERH
jgi:hypothetical protein